MDAVDEYSKCSAQSTTSIVEAWRRGLSFAEFYDGLRGETGRRRRRGTDHYHVLAALYNNKEIDDRYNPPINDEGNRVFNVRSRISDLSGEWGITGILYRIVGKHGAKAYFVGAQSLADSEPSRQIGSVGVVS